MTQGSPPVAGQVWDAQTYTEYASFVPEYGRAVFTELNPQPGEDILDLGCGTGVLTAHMAGRGAIAVGLEADPSMIEAARNRGVTVIDQDAHDPFGTERYDAVFSNAVLHWMRDPELVFQNACAALRPGGRFVAEHGGFGNIAALRIALNASLEQAGFTPRPCPWDFPRPDIQRARLERAGFIVEKIELFPRPTPLRSGIKGWLTAVGRILFDHIPEEAIAGIKDDTVRRLEPLIDADGICHADYVRLQFVARRPE